MQIKQFITNMNNMLNQIETTMRYTNKFFIIFSLQMKFYLHICLF